MPNGTRPNIILITTDQQRWDALGCAGNRHIRTPNLDRLAGEGVLFRQATSNCPVCVPARLSIVSGQMPGRHGVLENHGSDLTPEHTIPSLLNAAGYHTQAIGKMHFIPAEQRYGFQDMTLSEEMRWVRGPWQHADGRPRLDDYDRYLHERGLWGWEKPAEIGYNEIKPATNPLPLEHHVTTWCGDRTVAYLRRAHEKPFFLWASFVKPHCPYDAPRGCEDWYGPADVPAARRREGELDTKHANLKPYRRSREWHLYSEEAERMARANYYANVTLIDLQVGRILDTLKEEGLDDNTYVIYTSDNGPWYLGRSPHHKRRIGPDAEAHGGSALPLRGAKTSTWEGGLRVPCVMRAPGKIPAGTVCGEIASTMDMLPTLAALAGAEVPNDRVIDGHDIRDLIRGIEGAKSPTKAFYYYQRTHLQAVRAGKWKLHVPRPADRKWAVYSKAEDAIAIETPLLYDLEADIGETTNVANKHPEIVRKLMGLIEQGRKDIGDYNRIGEGARFFDAAPKRPDIQKTGTRVNAPPSKRKKK